MMKNLILFSLVFLCLNLSAQEAFSFRNYQVTINVNEDGSMDVIEDMDVEFEEKRHGIIRNLPYRYNVEDRPYTLTYSDFKVDGAPFQSKKGSHDITLRIGDGSKFVIGSQDYEIQYSVSGAFTKYSTHDEFYWNVISPHSDAQVDQASFSIRFPYEWRDSITEFISYSGRQGATTSEVYLSKNGALISGAIKKPLKAREGITLAVKVPKGLIQYPTNNSIAKSVESIEEGPAPWWQKFLLSIPLGIGGFLFYLYGLMGRAKDKEEVPLQFYPPDDLTPAEVGTFYDYKVNRRDIISLVPFWGELGLVKIRPLEDEDGDLSFYKLNEISEDRPSYERDFFNELFKDGDTVLLSDLTNKFYAIMGEAGKGIKREVEDMNLYDPDSMTTQTKWNIAFLVLGTISLGAFFLAAFEAIFPGILTLVLGFISIGLFFKNRKLSELGEETHRHLRGLRQWLKDPEPSQLNTIMEENPNYLSQIFPYVMAFGLDKSWEKRFDDLAVPPPIWYDYNHAGAHNSNYNYGQFTKDFQPHKIEQVFYSSPAQPPGSSSGGSISGGGGFSGGSVGGGFGGGSTSSW